MAFFLTEEERRQLEIDGVRAVREKQAAQQEKEAKERVSFVEKLMWTLAPKDGLIHPFIFRGEVGRHDQEDLNAIMVAMQQAGYEILSCAGASRGSSARETFLIFYR